MSSRHLTTSVTNFWLMASSPWRERGVFETLRSIHHSWHARRRELVEGFDRRFGTDTGRTFSLADLHASGGDVQSLWRYWPTLEDPFHRLMEATAIRFSDYAFVDLGSGKGRALLLASSYPFRRIVGVELAPALHQIAERNLAVYRSPTQRSSAFELVCMDAAEYAFPSGNLFLYLFQPFPREVFARVIANLRRTLAEEPREIVVAYQNPLFHDMLVESGLFSVENRGGPKGPAEFGWVIYRATPERR
jgi:SAM-dependent methyltransferase